MINKILTVIAVIIVIVLLIIMLLPSDETEQSPAGGGGTNIIQLPEPDFSGGTSVEQALLERRSVRIYGKEPIDLAEVSQLLWAAQGITDTKGYRTAPSAGALYPLEVYVAAGNVNDLPDGIYQYRSVEHELVKVVDQDRRTELARAASGQEWMKDSAAIIVFSAVYERTTGKYGERGIRYVHMEAGHASQNVYLQAVSSGLGTVVVGAFDDNEIKRITGMTDAEQPLCLMPVGRK